MRTLPNLEMLSESEKQNLTLELWDKLQSAEARLEEIEELQRIFRRWVRLKQKLFPSCCRGEVIRGVDLDTLDADVAGCISTFLMRGQLKQAGRESLYYSDDCLDVVTLELQGYEGWYFRQLKALTSSIIEYERRFIPEAALSEQQD